MVTTLKSWLAVPVSLALGALLCAAPTFALTSTDQDTAMNSYNNAFYTVSGSVGNFVVDTNRGAPGQGEFWRMAEKLEMVEDAYERGHNSTYQGMINQLCAGFTQVNGASWSWNSYNDDVCWATMAFARAYLDTGNTAYYTTALNNYNMMWNRAYDTSLGGGLWWSTAKTSKNACVEGPGAIAALLLYQCGAGSAYLSRAQSVFSWEASKLYNSNGAVSDNMSSSGALQGGPTSYNQGTFIGAADLLDVINKNKTEDGYAAAAASYTRNSMTGGIQPGILTDEYAVGSGTSDNAGFDGIFARWCCRWVKDSGHSEYTPWLLQNAQVAWNSRNTAKISWGHWGEATVNGYLTSWECSDAVAIIQGAPLTALIANGVHTLTPACATGLRLDDNAAGTTNGNKVQIWTSNGTAAQQWNFANIGGTDYNLAVNLGPYCLDVANGGTANGTGVDIYSCNGTLEQSWSVVGGLNGQYQMQPEVAPGSCLDVYSAGATNGTTVDIWQCNGTNAQQWAIN